MVRPAHDSTAKDLRIAEIRRQIAAGTYETPDKISAALDAFLSGQERAGDPENSENRPVTKRPR